MDMNTIKIIWDLPGSVNIKIVYSKKFTQLRKLRVLLGLAWKVFKSLYLYNIIS